MAIYPIELLFYGADVMEIHVYNGDAMAEELMNGTLFGMDENKVPGAGATYIFYV